MQEIDDEFEVKLGRIGSRKGGRATGYLGRVRQEAQKIGVRPRRPSLFTGARIGRGYAYGIVLAGRASAAGQRRVVVKTRIIRNKAGDTGAVRAHFRYVQRDGVNRDGQPGELYDATSDRAAKKAFTDRGAGDRHQFRFIISAEDSAELAELKPFIRDLMRQMEQDLGTKLDWIAADHFNTGHPHTHLVVRGKDDTGKDLIIARDYITYGLPARAADLVTRELGPETEIEAARRRRQEVTAERLTRLDRAILRDARDGSLVISNRLAKDSASHANQMGRLRTLERMGLAEENTPGHWHIDLELEVKLRRMGARGDIIETIDRELAAAGLSQAPGNYMVFDPERSDQRLIGRVVGEGFSNAFGERRYLVIDGIDGRTHYAEIGTLSSNEEPPVRGTIVELRSRATEPHQIDRSIAKIAESQHGETMHVAQNPVRIAVQSWQKLEDLPRALGATWLDRQLLAKTPEALGPSGMGAEVKNALRARRQWLIEQGLAREHEGQVQYVRDLMRTLEARELAHVAADISAQTALEHIEVKAGDKLSGVYSRLLTLNSGRFALIERSHDFALVRWRPELERVRGQVVTGSVGLEGTSWSIAIKRGLAR